MLKNLLSRLRAALLPEPTAAVEISANQRDILLSKVEFYRSLTPSDKKLFEQRCVSFIENTEIVGHELDVSEADKLLIASGSVILAWGFKQWHYVKVDTVYLVPGSFNDSSEFRQKDSNITGQLEPHT